MHNWLWVVLLLALVALSIWLQMRSRRSLRDMLNNQNPRQAAGETPRFDLNPLLDPYRARFRSLSELVGERKFSSFDQASSEQSLLDKAYALCQEGSALVARLESEKPPGTLPAQLEQAAQAQFAQMRTRRDALDLELLALEQQLVGHLKASS